MAIVGPARPLTEQFCPTSQQIIPREELQKMMPTFFRLIDAWPWVMLIAVMIEQRVMKISAVSAVMFMGYNFPCFTRNFA